MIGICDSIRETCRKVSEASKDVKINLENLRKLAAIILDEKEFENIEWRKYPGHYFDPDDEELTINYIFVLDCLNFCFWPSSSGWEYENIAGAIKNIIQEDPKGLEASTLCKISFEQFKKSFFADMDFPLLKERYRLIQELGYNCLKHFDGKFKNIVLASKNKSEDVTIGYFLNL